MKLKGVVLAGGKSSRFGEDKALAVWDGKTLLERAVDLLSSLQLDPVVIANPGRDYSFLNCPVVNDLIPEKGPLGGLYTACTLFSERTLLVLTCDMPLLNQNILTRLINQHQYFCSATVINMNGKIQPFPGVYKADLKTLIYAQLMSDKLSMALFLTNVLNRRILTEVSDAQMFQNVNHRKDLELIRVNEQIKG